MDDEPVTLRHLAAGAYHDHHVLSVDGTGIVLRRCTGSQWGLPPAEQLAREHATLLALAPTGVAPRPLTLLDRPPLLLEEHVRGDAFSYASDLPALARALVPVHALAPAHLPAVDPIAELLEDGGRWLALAREAGTDAEAVARIHGLSTAATAGPAPTSPPVLVHTDLNAGNLLVEADGAVRLLDWEAARRGPAAWDLAHALSPTTTRWDARSACTLTGQQVDGFLRAYADAGGSPEVLADLDALIVPVVFRALAWCLGVRGEHALGRRELSGDLSEALERLTRTEAVIEAVTWAQAPR